MHCNLRGNIAKSRLWLLAAASVLWACALGTPVLAKGKDTMEKGSSARFVPLDAFHIAVLEGKSPRGVLVVELGLDVPDPAMRTALQPRMARLRDHFLRSLKAFVTTEVTLSEPVNVNRLKGRLQAVAKAYAGENVQVLLVNVLAHRR